MSRYKILKMQKPNLIYISFGDPHFCRLTAWKKKTKNNRRQNVLSPKIQ
jgi:hypothetical protein